MREEILLVTDCYAQALGVGRKRVSKILLNRGSKLDDIANGGDLVTATFERSMQWLSDNWPTDAVWPEEVQRPERSMQEAAE